MPQLKHASFTKAQYERARKNKSYLMHLTIRDPGKKQPGSVTTIAGPVNDEISEAAWQIMNKFGESK